MAEFEQELYFGGDYSYFELDVACNWKLALENYCDAYHLPFVHLNLHSYSHLGDHYNILDDASYAGQGSNVYEAQISDEGQELSKFRDLSEKWNTAAEYCAFSPNVLYGVHKDHTFASILSPQGQKTTIERVAFYYADAQMLAAAYASMRAKNAAMWKDVFMENIEVL